MLKQRILSTAIMVPIALAIIFLLPLKLFSIITGLLTVVAAWEWANLAGWINQPLRVLYALITGCIIAFFYFIESRGFLLGTGLAWWIMAVMLIISYPESKSAWKTTVVKLIIGWLVMLPAWASLISIRSHEYGSIFLLYLFGIVWIADIAAYFCGRFFGRHKLAPKISPNKTWQGAIGGFITVAIFSLIVGWITGFSSFHQLGMLVVSLIVCIFSVFGDLLESMFKRERGIKNSSNLLPGHGGVLDRIDSLTAAAPIFAIFWMLATGL